jgi:carbon-monoxide dehydrogenase large subunit
MRGVGEGGAIIGPPTLVNAIADALAVFGEVPVDLPLTPAKLLSVIEGRDIASSAGPALSFTDAIGQEQLVPVLSEESADAAVPAECRIDGDWKMVLSTPVGPQEMKGHFETEGPLLSGYLSSAEGQQAFTGSVEGNRLKFDLKVVKPMKITLKYDLVVEGDRISGKVKMGIFGSAKLTGERIRMVQEA